MRKINKTNVKLVRTKVGRGTIYARDGRDGRVISWSDTKKRRHVGTRVRQRSHKS